MIGSLPTHHWVALAVATLALIFDLRTRRIPNFLTFGAAAAALVFSLITGGPGSLLASAGGWLTGCALFFPFFALGGLGAGDVKLAAAIGAWLMPVDAFWMAIFGMIAGGVFGVIVALATGYFRQATDNLYMLLAHWRVVGIRPVTEFTLEGSGGPRLPYALPIAAGTAAVIFWR